MAFEWEKMFRRYVSDEIRTPYRVAPEKLTRTQARYELFAYTLFMAVGFSMIGVASVSGKLPHGDAVGVSIYAFFMVWAAIVFGYSKNQMAAAFCATAPIAVLLYFLVYGFSPASNRDRQDADGDRRGGLDLLQLAGCAHRGALSEHAGSTGSKADWAAQSLRFLDTRLIGRWPGSSMGDGRAG